MKCFHLPLFLALASALPVKAAPIPITSSFQVYSQNFDTLPSATNNAGAAVRWSDDVTLPGWYAHRALNASTASSPGAFDGGDKPWFVADGAVSPNGSSLTFSTYSLGAANSTDRSLGSAASSATGEISQMVVFKNQRQYAVRISGLSYVAKAYRKNSGINPEKISVSVKTADSVAELVNNMTTEQQINGRVVTGWRSVPQAEVVFPMNELSGTGLPMTQLPPRVIEVNVVEPDTQILVPPGKVLALRFGNANDDGTDGIIGIDNLRVEFFEVPCDIYADFSSNVQRNTRGTPQNPLDDTVDFTADVFGSGFFSSTGYRITAPPSLVGGPFPYETKAFSIPISAFPAAGNHELSITFQDTGNESCTATLKVVPPWCSQAIEALTVDASAAGDNYSVQVLVTGEYVGGGFSLGTQTGTYGSPLWITGLSKSNTTVRLLTDLTDSNCQRSITFFPALPIGQNLISGQPIHSDVLRLPAPWVVNPSAGTMTLNNAGAEEGSSLWSELINVSNASGLMRFTALLEVAESSGSGNFETADQFKAEILIDEGLPTETVVNLVEPYDRNGFFNPDGVGWMNGYTDASSRPYDDNRELDEFNKDGNGGESGVERAGALTAAFSLQTLIPDSASTVRLVISGDNDAADEFFVVRNSRLELVQPNLTVSNPSNILRNENGPGIADDTVSFDLTIANDVGGTGWTSNRLPANGLFGNVRFTMPVTENSIRIADVDRPDLFKVIPISVPNRYTIGSNRIAGEVPIYSLAAASPPPEWVNSPSQRSLTMSNSGGAEKVLLSEVIDLTGVAGDLELTAVFEATETSGTSNFESSDIFRADLVLNGNSAAPVNLIRSSWDRNEFTGSRIGYLNGYDGDDDFPYDLHRTRDEFNRGQSAPFTFGQYAVADRNWTARFDFRQVIPDAVQSVQLRVFGANNSVTEIFHLRDVVLAPSAADSDNDGMSDLYEQQYQLNPSDPDDAELDLDGDGQSNLAEFWAGTAANNGASVLRITGMSRNAANGEITVQFPAIVGKSYRPATTTDPAGSWTTHAVVTPSSTTGQAIIPASVFGGAARGFIRIHVER